MISPSLAVCARTHVSGCPSNRTAPEALSALTLHPAAMRVLYVDDDRVNALLFLELGRLAQGVVIESAASAGEALELIAELPFDLLVLDFHLPDATGFELLPRLRAQAGNSALPAVLCTADDGPALREQALAAGFLACWSKPLELQRVLDDLQRLSASM